MTSNPNNPNHPRYHPAMVNNYVRIIPSESAHTRALFAMALFAAAILLDVAAIVEEGESIFHSVFRATDFRFSKWMRPKLFKVLDFALNSYEYIWYATLISISGVGTWLLERRVQRKMARILHRKPEDHELVSLSSWIRAMETEDGATGTEGRKKAD